MIEPLEDDPRRYQLERFKGGVPEARAAIESVLAADLILLDILGPSGTSKSGRWAGIDFLKELRERHHYTKPVVCFSVVNQPDVLARLHELGVAEILQKPTRPSILKKTIDSLVEPKRP